MDCDDAELLLAARERRTLTTNEAASLDDHMAACAACQELAAATDGEAQARWVVRVPEDALDDPDLLVLPTVDPVLFASERELAVGGMGRITRVRDRRLGRDVALKEVLDPAMRARFEREVAITAQLQHPAIVPVYEAGAWPDGSAFYTMRLVSGGTLAEAIGKTETLEQRLALLPHVIAATDALAYAHSRGIVHRDLKPGNVLVGEFGETVVIDWGLAKELRRKIDDPAEQRSAPHHGLTQVGSVLGTPGFMSPEQAAGADVDERADVYALGAILYNLLAGTPPYWGHPVGELVEVARTQPPRPLAELAPRAPADLRAIADRAMARTAAERYPTAKEMAEELHRFQAGQLLRSREYRLRELIARWIRRHRAAVAVGTLALIAVGAIGIGAIRNVTRSRTAAERAQVSAEASVVRLLEEQGRAQLLAGDREHALAYLSDAYSRGGDGVALRHLIAEAARDVDLRDRTIDEHGAMISDVAFAADGHPVTTALAPARLSHDGRRVAVISSTGAVSVHDTTTGAELWSANIPDEPALDAAFDRTGHYLAVWSVAADGGAVVRANVRDAETGAVTLRITNATDRFAFSADGARVAWCVHDSQLRVWATRDGAPVTTLAGCGGLDSFVFLDEDRIVIERGPAEVAIILLDGADSRVVLGGNHGMITALAIDPFADRIAVADSNGRVSMWARDGDLLGTARANVHRLEFSPDGSLLAGGGRDRRVHVWDGTSLEQLASVAAAGEHGDADVDAIAWSPDGHRFATLRTGDTHAYIYRAPRGHRVFSTTAIASAIGGTIAITTDQFELEVHDLATGVIARTLKLDVRPPNDTPLELGADGTRALVTTWQLNRVEVIDPRSGAIVLDRRHPEDAAHKFDYHLSADGRFVVEVSHSGAPGQLRVIDVATGRVVREVTLPGEIGDTVISPTGAHVAVAGDGFPARLIEVATGKTFEVYTPRHFAFDPTGARVLTFGTAAARIFDVHTGQPLVTFTEVPGEIKQAQFDDSGHRLATWSDDRAARVWDADSGQRLLALEGVGYGAIALSGDATRVATGYEDGMVRIWDTASGKLLEELPDAHTGVPLLAWSHDRTRLFAQSTYTNAVTLWDVHLETRTPAEIAALATLAPPEGY